MPLKVSKELCRSDGCGCVAESARYPIIAWTPHDSCVWQTKLANSNELLERSILRTQQHEHAVEHDHDSEAGTGSRIKWCPGGCGRVVECAALPPRHAQQGQRKFVD